MEEQKEVVIKKKKIWPFILIGIIFVIACSAMFVLIGRSTAKADAVQQKLELGHKYLDELDYEQALASYMGVLDIEPRSVDAYMGVINKYISMGDLENALLFAQEGYSNTQDEVFSQKMEEINALKDAALQLEEQSRQENEETGSQFQEINGVREEIYDTFHTVVGENEIMVEAENLHVTINRATGEIVATVSGLSLQDSYHVNRTGTPKSYVEYEWEIYLSDGVNHYSMGTCYSVEEENKDNTILLTDMEHRIVCGNVERLDLEPSVEMGKMTHTGDSMTWKFVLPEGNSINFEDIRICQVHILNSYEFELSESRFYVPE
ncbi:MAG: hypothetical protein IJA29_10435 [Lachnospiraceae bacterium]|nr:hypothetical protein [Lachnospiraceae bacterium]